MILVIAGTRPELVKLAPVVRLARERGLPVHVHCTMQSPDLVDRNILNWDTITYDSEGGVAMPDIGARLVVVQGDTRTAFEWAVRAYEQGVPVFHLEAGVRTYDFDAPWPEEGYRQMISRIATYHAATTGHNEMNVAREMSAAIPNSYTWGGARDRYRPVLRMTGSPVVDSIRERVAALHTAPVGTRKQILLTLHRRENRPYFTDIVRAVAGFAFLHDLSVLWPTHPNGWALDATPEDVRSGLTIVPPLSPTAFAQALLDSALVVTDSGGVQEECNALRIPCAVMRSITDRPESVGPEGGAVVPSQLTGAAPFSALGIGLAYDRSQINPDIFGDGHASERIVTWWEEILRG